MPPKPVDLLHWKADLFILTTKHSVYPQSYKYFDRLRNTQIWSVTQVPIERIHGASQPWAMP